MKNVIHHALWTSKRSRAVLFQLKKQNKDHYMNVVVINLASFMMKYSSIVDVNLMQVLQDINKYPKWKIKKYMNCSPFKLVMCNQITHLKPQQTDEEKILRIRVIIRLDWFQGFYLNRMTSECVIFIDCRRHVITFLQWYVLQFVCLFWPNLDRLKIMKY